MAFPHIHAFPYFLLAVALGCGKPEAVSTSERGTAAPVAVQSPNGGETWIPGSVVSVEWTAGTEPSPMVGVYLCKAGSRMRTIAEATRDDGRYDWRVPSDADEGDDYTVEVDRNGQTSDSSDAPFRIGPARTQDYFPLEPGRTWTYKQEGGSRTTARVLDEPGDINGQTTVVIGEESGRQDYYTLDETGLYLHGLIAPETGATMTFVPPLHVAAATLVPGTTTRSAGTVQTTGGSEAPPEPMSYSATVVVDSFADVTVPAGPMHTIKLGGLLALGDGHRMLFTVWLAPGLGQVQRAGDRSLTLVEAKGPSAG